MLMITNPSGPALIIGLLGTIGATHGTIPTHRIQQDLDEGHDVFKDVENCRHNDDISHPCLTILDNLRQALI